MNQKTIAWIAGMTAMILVILFVLYTLCIFSEILGHAGEVLKGFLDVLFYPLLCALLIYILSRKTGFISFISKILFYFLLIILTLIAIWFIINLTLNNRSYSFMDYVINLIDKGFNRINVFYSMEFVKSLTLVIYAVLFHLIFISLLSVIEAFSYSSFKELVVSLGFKMVILAAPVVVIIWLINDYGQWIIYILGGYFTVKLLLSTLRNRIPVIFQEAYRKIENPIPEIITVVFLILFFARVFDFENSLDYSRINTITEFFGLFIFLALVNNKNFILYNFFADLFIKDFKKSFYHFLSPLSLRLYYQAGLLIRENFFLIVSKTKHNLIWIVSFTFILEALLGISGSIGLNFAAFVTEIKTLAYSYDMSNKAAGLFQVIVFIYLIMFFLDMIFSVILSFSRENQSRITKEVIIPPEAAHCFLDRKGKPEIKIGQVFTNVFLNSNKKPQKKAALILLITASALVVLSGAGVLYYKAAHFYGIISMYDFSNKDELIYGEEKQRADLLKMTGAPFLAVCSMLTLETEGKKYIVIDRRANWLYSLHDKKIIQGSDIRLDLRRIKENQLTYISLIIPFPTNKVRLDFNRQAKDVFFIPVFFSAILYFVLFILVIALITFILFCLSISASLRSSFLFLPDSSSLIERLKKIPGLFLNMILYTPYVVIFFLLYIFLFKLDFRVISNSYLNILFYCMNLVLIMLYNIPETVSSFKDNLGLLFNSQETRYKYSCGMNRAGIVMDLISKYGKKIFINKYIENIFITMSISIFTFYILHNPRILLDNTGLSGALSFDNIIVQSFYGEVEPGMFLPRLILLSAYYCFTAFCSRLLYKDLLKKSSIDHD